MSRTVVTDSPNAPRPDGLIREVADGLIQIGNNYAREGSGPGSRFEGELLEDAQAKWAFREIRYRGEASEDFVITLDALLLAVVLASEQARSLLAECLMCRNSLLYLLDRPAPVQRGIHQKMRIRLEALEIIHEDHADSTPDSTRPRIRGIICSG